jgi:hypothetical protein
MSSLVVIAAVQDFHLSIIDESVPPLLHPPNLSINIQTLRDEVVEEETRTEVETRDKLYRPSNITASKSITLIDRQVEPDPARDIQATGSDQAATRDMLLESGTYSLPTPIGRFIPAPVYHSLNRHCIDTTVDNNSMIIGRIASRYAGQLRDELDTAQEHCKQRSIRTHNELKVKWLENTQWANVCDVPINANPALALLPNADVWYMQ